jgi:DNA repair exonuclease SbcCD ATPase subunit
MNPTSATLTPSPSDAAGTSTDRVSDLIQKLVAAATAEVESAAERARAQAQIEKAQLQQTIDRLRDELQSERDRLKAISEQLAAARANTTKLEEQLEAERTEKARFAATLETVRLVVSGTDVELHGAAPNPAVPADVAEADDDVTDEELDLDETSDLELVDGSAAAFHAVDSSSEPYDEDGAGHLTQLLAQIEEIYRSDLKSAEGTSEVVARLAANLAYARDAYARRIDSAEGGDAGPFDRALSTLLMDRSDTPFGRHLAMALRSSTATSAAP